MLMANRLILTAFALVLSTPTWASPGHFDFGQPASAAKASRSIDVVMGDMTFDPGALDIKAGETVRFVLINKGQLLHEFNLGNAAMHAQHQQEMLKMQQSGQLTPTAMKQGMAHGSMGHGQAGMRHEDPNSVLVEPGKTAELTWTFNKAMRLEFACNVPGHYQAGMKGKLTVSQ
ncbi:copper-binding protein [Pseudomonas sp. Fig-3]|uniref:Copper-binding protein n=1 Tax=Pseudomonas rhizophila TaxID=2045200 RepID=A0ABN5JY07_9PSED|nr:MULTISPECIES: cupredoxin family protein [Pseudomonas]AVU77724.1 copper-binding protein [Pseudomonas rhizophila]TNB80185.1 copper-binding protein [Pseudomonas sp. Fig-3]VII92462.1 Copper tolerance protein [Pseudomonas sp. FG-3G]